MRKYINSGFVILLLMTGVDQLLANPVPITLIEEFLIGDVNPDAWVLELQGYMTMSENLNGWFIVSSSGTSEFKQGISTQQENLLLINNDSLMTPLSFSAENGVIAIFDSSGDRWDEIRWGDISETYIHSPLPGQSICFAYLPGPMYQIWYLDNSPTLGYSNDTAGGEGTIQAIVYDANVNPLAGAYINFRPGPAYDYMTGTAGTFEFTQSASLTPITIAYNSVIQVDTLIQLYPDSLLNLVFRLPHVVGVHELQKDVLPREYFLGQNYPNPFNPETRIIFDLPESDWVRLRILGLDGSVVATLADQTLQAGSYSVTWNAAGLPSGMYLYQLRAGSFCQTRKLSLLK